ncbi:MAG: hypothetical protein R8F63_13570 [Acidimicrobiales bacterium]|nr:hypothetical protein [Acidimicrobiales bacterium]
MSDLSDLLRELSVPEHAPDFWTRLESQIDAVDATESARQRRLAPVPETELVVVEPDPGEPAPHRLRRRALLIAAAAATVLAVLFGLGELADDGAPAPTITDEDLPTTTTRASTTTTTTTEGPPDSSTVPAPADDGSAELRSLGLPLDFSSATGLTDLQPVEVAGSGFDPGASLAVLQCHGPMDSPDDGNLVAAVDGCDLSGYRTLVADENGEFVTTYQPRRFMSNEHGSFDCANPGPPNVCGIAAGDTLDLTSFGIREVTFAASADASAAPHLVVDRSVPFAAGQTVTVTGRGFAPGEPVEVAICSLDAPAWSTCRGSTAAYRFTADGNGEFVAEMPMHRIAGGADCTSILFGCRLVGFGGRVTHPLLLEFDTTEAATGPASLPDARVPADAASARLEIPTSEAPAGSMIEARVCTDVNRLPPEQICGPAVSATGTGATTTVEIPVGTTIGDGESVADCIDWRSTATDLCHLVVTTDSYRYPPVNLVFEL